MKNKHIKVLSIINLILIITFVSLLLFIHNKNLNQSKDVDNLTANIDDTSNITDDSEQVDTEENSEHTPNDNQSDDISDPDADPEDSSNSSTDKSSEDAYHRDPKSDSIVLAFAGDVNFSEDSKTIAHYDKEQKGILGALSADLVDEMNAADITMLNNEFPYSTRGTKTPNKSYTFRAAPSRINLLHEMGVDIVSLANNHALDYGQDALLDTFTHLEDEGIDYIGAGIDMDRAKAAVYYTIGDTKIAYLAASRVVFATDWYATDTRPGMIGAYDPTLFIECIKEAAANSDFVVTFLHWGVELKNYPEEYQRKLAKQFIDAGADVVIGCHPHVLQGFEFYKGKPIAYSLGNYWFNASTNKTGLFKLYLDANDKVRVQIVPAAYSNAYTSMITDEAQRKEYFKFMQKLSFQANIDEDGFITEAVQ